MKSVITVVVLVLLFVVVAVSGSKTETISLEDQNMDIVKLSCFAFSEGDWSSFADLHSPDYLQHSPGFEDPITWPDYELAARIVRNRLPDLKFSIVDIFAARDKVAVRSVWECRSGCSRYMLPSNDGVIRGSEISIFRIEDGKIIEEWCEHNLSSVEKFVRSYKSMEHLK